MTADPYHHLRVLVRSLENLKQYGCTNHGCRMVRRDAGFYTNGPCHCIESLAEICFAVAIEADRVKRMLGSPLF